MAGCRVIRDYDDAPVPDYGTVIGPTDDPEIILVIWDSGGGAFREPADGLSPVPGRHESPEAVTDRLEAARAASEAAALVATINRALLIAPERPSITDGASSDLIEWCRSARDVLIEMAHGHG